jgi:hypothetical protein
MRLLTASLVLILLAFASAARGADSSNVINDCQLTGELVLIGGTPEFLAGGLNGEADGSLACDFNAEINIDGFAVCYGNGQLNANGRTFGTADELMLIPTRDPAIFYFMTCHTVTEGGSGYLFGFGFATLKPGFSEFDVERYLVDADYWGAIYPDKDNVPRPEVAPRLSED